MATKVEDRAAGRYAEPQSTEPKRDQSELTRAKEPESGSVRNTQPARTADDRRRRIAEAAYYRAERRGFAAGFEDVDWMEAEKEIDSRDDTVPGKRKPAQSAGRASGVNTAKPAP